MSSQFPTAAAPGRDPGHHEVEAVVGADGTSEIWLQNLKHMACRMMAVAVGRRGEYRDHGMRWTHGGKNGHYGPIAWSA